MKIAITGASMAGLYLAYLLAREGVEVEVYEKEKRGEAARRTLIVTDKLAEILEFDVSGAVLNKINRYEILSDGQQTTINLNSPDLVIERKELLEILARQAEAAGARIFWGNEVVGIKKIDKRNNSSLVANKPPKTDSYHKEIEAGENKTNGKKGKSNKAEDAELFSLRIREVESGNERVIERPVVVLAGGVNWLPSTNGQRKLAVVQARVTFPDGGLSSQAEKKLDLRETKDLRQRTCRVWLDTNRGRYFFWLIPESSEVAAIGLIDERMGRAAELLRSFLEEKKLKPVEIQAALVPEYRGDSIRVDGNGFRLFRGVPSNGASGLYAVGDAAAQVKMTTVGGVVAGLRGAKVVAEAILNRNNYRRALCELYHELNLHYLLRRSLNRFRNEDYARVLARLEQDEELRRILGQRSRDELSRFILKLALKRPWLAALGIKSLLRSFLP